MPNTRKTRNLLSVRRFEDEAKRLNLTTKKKCGLFNPDEKAGNSLYYLFRDGERTLSHNAAVDGSLLFGCSPEYLLGYSAFRTESAERTAKTLCRVMGALDSCRYSLEVNIHLDFGEGYINSTVKDFDCRRLLKFYPGISFYELAMKAQTFIFVLKWEGKPSRAAPYMVLSDFTRKSLHRLSMLTSEAGIIMREVDQTWRQ